MASLAKPVPQTVTFAVIRTRTRRECRLFSRALMRVPRKARVAIAISLGLLAICSLYLVLAVGS
jgi:hypothetical protein